MPKDFSRGKVYRLIAPSGLQYVGSTQQPRLSDRLRNHREKYRRWKKGLDRNYISSYELFEEDYDGVVIELLESYPCNGIDELHKREGHWIRTIEGGCVNRRVSGRTDAEYYEANRERIRARHAEWYAENRERIQARDAEYYAANAERLRAYQAEYRAANRERERAQAAKRIVCECGAEVRRTSMARHRRTAKHTAALENAA